MVVLLDPHVGQVIISVSGVSRINGYGFFKKIRRFVVKTGLFCGRAIVEIKSGVGNLGAFSFGFMQSLFECGDRFLEMLRFALSDAQVVSDFLRLRKVLPRFAQNFHGPLVLLQRTEKELGQMKIWAGSTRIDDQTLLVISSSFRKRRFCLIGLFFAFERAGAVIQ